jgi:hypothetical protein
MQRLLVTKLVKNTEGKGKDKQKYLWGMTDGYDNQFYVDAPPFMFYQGYYINHSSTPNCFWNRRTGDIYSQVQISEGEELTMYYIPSERDF